jgi:hypothetical protein
MEEVGAVGAVRPPSRHERLQQAASSNERQREAEGGREVEREVEQEVEPERAGWRSR